MISGILIDCDVLPNADNRGHDIDDPGKLTQALNQSPSFRRVDSQFFVQPIPVHDVKVNFVGPVMIEMLVRGRSVPRTW